MTLAEVWKTIADKLELTDKLRSCARIEITRHWPVHLVGSRYKATFEITSNNRYHGHDLVESWSANGRTQDKCLHQLVDKVMLGDKSSAVRKFVSVETVPIVAGQG